VHVFELQGDVFNGGGEADNSITGFVVAFAYPESAKRCHAD
jgi:hypothetical protein